MAKVKNLYAFLLIVGTIVGCKSPNDDCHHVNSFGNFELYASTPYLSKYCYIIVRKNTVSDTIQIYKSESNQILLFYEKESMDTLFVCDRWNNTQIQSNLTSIETVKFNDLNYFLNIKGSQYILRPEYELVCIPEIKDLQQCY
jgi:hypothetical protein